MTNLLSSAFITSKTNFEDFPILQNDLKAFLVDPRNNEKRRRNLAFFFFKRIFSQATYIDFFSKETIHSLLLAKKIAQILSEKEFNEDILFLSLCLNPETNLCILLKKYGVSNQELIQKHLSKKKYKKLSKETLKSFEKKILRFTSFSVFKAYLKGSVNNLTFLVKNFRNNFLGVPFQNIKHKKKNLNNKHSTFARFLFKLFFFKRPLKHIKLSSKCAQFLESVMKVAEDKYKTPVISVDLLSLAFLNSRYNVLVTSHLNSLEQFYELKYDLTKKFYKEESSLKEEIVKSRQYFSYLLKSTISETIFQKLITKEKLFLTGDLQMKTDSIREFLVKKLLKVNIFKILEIEILKCIFVSSNIRAYKYTF